MLEGIDAEDVDVFEEKTKIIISKVQEDSSNSNDGDDNNNHENLDENLSGDAGDDLNESEIDKYLPFSQD
jgi:hypothetical protein